ncbi:MAG TPA: hypothetical protein VKM93_21770 [Terriglobia bacterium]|nr:hypothetical protein [Terriglobia bacterium]
MKRSTYFLILALACIGLATWGGRTLAADEPAKVDGAWDFSSETPRGTMTSTLTIQQDGATLKGTMKGQRGESPLQGSVTGNKISFTVTRDTPNGTFTIEYTGTLDGDTITGTSHSERFDGKWTAKRQVAK